MDARVKADAVAGEESGVARLKALVKDLVVGPDGGSAEEPGERGRKVPGGGWSSVLEVPPEFEAPSNQICGLWPFSAGSGLPADGAILGRHQTQMTQVCADPVTWFLMGRILNPSAFVLGRPGLGKSTLIRRIITFLAAKGVVPLILSDLKPDYVKLIVALGGLPVTVGHGGSSINPLDPGPAVRGLAHMDPDRATRTRAQLEARRLNTLVGLCELVRGEGVSDFERTALRTAIRVLDPDLDNTPLVDEVREVIESRHPDVRRVIRDRGSDDRYDERTERLVDALQGVGSEGAFGETFARHTTVPMVLDQPMVFDMSEVDDNDLQLQAALQLVCWSYGSAIVQGAKTLAAAGLEPERIYLLVMDELWRALRASLQMVDRIDAITRLNRQLLFPQIMCTHTMDDLRLATEAATTIAWGFVSRSEMVYLGGLAPKEMGNLDQVFSMPAKEQNMLTTWSDMNTVTGSGTPAGLGLFLLKLGSNPGIPFRLDLTAIEADVNNTNERWAEFEYHRREAT